MIAVVFPGQGAQHVGMGTACADASPAARRAFDSASAGAGLDLLALCRSGPEERLRETELTQPAILAASAAVMAMLAEAGVRPAVAAGLSLGEYTALVAAGAIGLGEAAALVRRRGRYMQEAVPDGVGAMAAVLGLAREAVEEACAGVPGVVSPANYNCPGQTVIAGAREAVTAAAERCRQAGARRVTLLPVSAPFHCSLMAPAAARLEADLAGAHLAPAAIPVVCNVDARPLTEPAAVRDALLRQVDRPVRWQEGVEVMLALGCDVFLEVGPGSALTGFLRRIAPGVRGLSCQGPEDVAACAAALGVA